ncbi:MAG TPA: type II toxin-antitoxin system prevent-host-death family antitoxin [Xanthomonadaceae bacterium]|nr:type II toxin-antitoxin system prevent-host-death family antitoxin [Xanthomonadaceae bacterium]
MQTEWQLQEAKNKLSQLIKLAGCGEPQVITVHGKAAAVILSAAAYEKLTCSPAGSLSSALLAPDIGGEDLDFSRDRDTGREIAL